MGDPLAPEIFESFGDELTKEAISLGRAGSFILGKLRAPSKMGLDAALKVSRGTRGLMGEAGQAGERFFNPIKGMREGWAASAPTHRIAQEAAELGFKNPAEAAQILKGKQETIKKLMDAAKAQGNKASLRDLKGQLRDVKGQLGKVMPGGEHLVQPGTTLGQAAQTPGLMAKSKAVAEELSRRGWTGAGKRTKYLPVGTKGMNVGFGAASIPHVIDAQAASPTGEGGALERGLGVLGSTAGMVMGGGLGFIPAMGLWYGAEQAGSRLGRVVDRLRSGGTMNQALTAPSPEEAMSQLANIQRHYG